jgi:hypothetical protein
MSKKFQRIISEVVARWQNTILHDTAVDVDAAKKLLIGKNKKIKVFAVDSPLQFYIAQAIIRGRIAKSSAKEYCDYLGIDSAFAANVQKCGGMRDIVNGNYWSRHMKNNLMDNMMQQHLHKLTQKTKGSAIPARRWRSSSGRDNTAAIALCTLSDLYNLFISMPATGAPDVNEYEKLAYKLSYRNSRLVERAQITLSGAVSNFTEDLEAGEFQPQQHWFDAVHAEIVAKMLNCKDPEIIKYQEIFHYTPAVMQFRDAYLILGKRPVMRLDADDNLHNESGPAVQWADGKAVWFFEGHYLAKHGEKIIMAPETLKPKEIQEIDNEENRRVAIDRYGWGKYLHDSGAVVLDSRENWVDNTVEVLIAPRKTKAAFGREPLRMVLSCRSTGRKYFIAIPEILPESRFNPDNIAPINTCEAAQSWLANGAVCDHLPYAVNALNIVGAS